MRLRAQGWCNLAYTPLPDKDDGALLKRSDWANWRRNFTHFGQIFTTAPDNHVLTGGVPQGYKSLEVTGALTAVSGFIVNIPLPDTPGLLTRTPNGLEWANLWNLQELNRFLRNSNPLSDWTALPLNGGN